MRENLDKFIVELLHIDEAGKNKLIDLEAGDRSKAYYLSHPDSSNFSEYILLAALERMGKPSSVVLKNSAVGGSEQIIGRAVKTLDWVSGDGARDPKLLNKFIEGVYKDIRAKGNNPLFLSVGEIRWRVRVNKTEVKIVRSPVLVFPVRLIRSTGAGPVGLEFIDDEVFVNPCLINKMKTTLLGETWAHFPHPNGQVGMDEPVNLTLLSDGNAYFERLEGFIKECKVGSDEDTVFELNKDTVALAQYNHDELCMYYDVKRNRDKIENHPLVRRIFTYNDELPPQKEGASPRFTLARDSVQEEMIRRVVSGESLIIKGPPGTGKTLTIANMIASLLADGKRVMFVSKKLSALEEVYEKIPDKLKKFLLLLDYESEAQASKVNPSQIRKELKALLTEKEEYTPSDLAITNLSHARREESEATVALNGYAEQFFLEKKTGGVSYYDALDYYCKNDLPVIEFAPEELVVNCSREVYNATLSVVEEAGKWYDELTVNGKIPAYKNPWLGASEDTDIENARVLMEKTASAMATVLSAVDGAGAECGITPDLKIDIFLSLIGDSLTAEQKEKLIALKDRESAVEVLSEAYLEYEKEKEERGEIPFISVPDDLIELEISLRSLALDCELSSAQVEEINKNAAVFTSVIWTKPLFDEVLSVISETAQSSDRYSEYIYNARSVYKSGELTEKEVKDIVNAKKAFAKYEGSDKKAPDFFDFGAKSALKKISASFYTQSVTFPEIVKATDDYCKALEEKSLQRQLGVKMHKLFRRELTKEEIDCAVTVISRCNAKGVLPDEYAGAVVRDYEKVTSALRYLAKGCSVRELIDAYAVAVKREGVAIALNAFNATAELFEKLPTDKISAVKAILAYDALLTEADGDGERRAALEKFALLLCAKRARLLSAVSEYRAVMEKFAEDFYPTYYASGEESVEDIRLFSQLYADRTYSSVALAYDKALKRAEGNIPVYRLFEPFESGREEKRAEFSEYFEHSFYALAVKARLKSVSGTVGESVEYNLEKLSSAHSSLKKIETEICEQLLMARISLSDPDFAFLAHENDPGTLRMLFKEHARAILKLKPCTVLSPSSVSVLFRPEEYSSFDAVIIDEASQLEPVTVLPVAFRSKQCVIVGDEWQMPPIKHFETVNPDLDREPSLLGLALKNNAFRAEELRCHYRSKTESLIRFSQKRYYDNMRTFPAAVPKTDELGFTDIFVDGRCVSGANEEEARVVVERIKEHYRKYYRDGKLIRTLGVVAFGEKQIDKIKSLAKSDATLKSYRHNPDTEDGFFYRAIEKVQGQEASDLILSLTYGITAKGEESSSFAELNRGKLGECIFNVAVTRGQYTVTMVHSIRPEQISNERVSFIADYLRVVEQFAESGKEQFVSESVDKGFIASVREYILSLGIAPERVVVGYGVTEGSVRIPIAVLDESLSEAKLGIWCEKALGRGYDYIDYNMRYYNNLCARGWKLCRVYAHDWVNNAHSCRKELGETIKNNL